VVGAPLNPVKRRVTPELKPIVQGYTLAAAISAANDFALQSWGTFDSKISRED
jgi:hypothetical protein